jgi:hypothetical protein
VSFTQFLLGDILIVASPIVVGAAVMVLSLLF